MNEIILDDKSRNSKPNLETGEVLSDFDIEFYDYDCGYPCTPNGCIGHLTDIPLAFSVGGVTFHVDGAESGDFPDNKDNIELVRRVVNALAECVASHLNKSVSDTAQLKPK